MRLETRSLVDWLERLDVTQGDGYGEPFKVLPWQAEFLDNAFDPEVVESALSVPRGCGKSTLVGAVAAAAVIGPLAKKNAQVIVCAASFNQAKIVFDHAINFVEQKVGGLTRERFAWQDTAQKAILKDRKTGAQVRCIGAKPRTMHGLAPYLVCVDEPAQHEPAQAQAIIGVLRTSLGKIPGGKLFSIGTRPADPTHWFSMALNGQADYAITHSYESELDWWTPRAARAANPSWEHFPTLRKQTLKEAKLARQDVELEASYRALRLNAGVSETAVTLVISARNWKRIEVDRLPPAEGPMIVGIDIGGAASMSAWCSYWPETGRCEVYAGFPGKPSLRTRGRSDAVGPAYLRMQASGELGTHGGLSLDYEGFLVECAARFGPPTAVVLDRFKIPEIRDAMREAGISAPVVIRGQGFRDGSEDLRRLRRMVLERRVRVPKSLMLRMAMASARCISDPAGNVKLARGVAGGRRSVTRDDAVSAMILALGEGHRRLRRTGSFRWKVA